MSAAAAAGVVGMEDEDCRTMAGVEGSPSAVRAHVSSASGMPPPPMRGARTSRRARRQAGRPTRSVLREGEASAAQTQTSVPPRRR